MQSSDEQHSLSFLDRFKSAIASKRTRLILSRHAERVDCVFGSDWIKTALQNNSYNRFHHNMPPTLPIRYSTASYLMDTPITANGERISLCIGQLLRHYGYMIDVCYSSPALRCVQTSSMILQGNNAACPIAVEPAVCECLKFCNTSYYMTTNELRLAGYNINTTYNPLVHWIDYDNEQFYKERSQLFTNYINKEFEDDFNKVVLVVGHATTPDILSRLLLKSSLEKSVTNVDYSSISILERNPLNRKWYTKRKLNNVELNNKTN